MDARDAKSIHTSLGRFPCMKPKRPGGPALRPPTREFSLTEATPGRRVDEPMWTRAAITVVRHLFAKMSVVGVKRHTTNEKVTNDDRPRRHRRADDDPEPGAARDRRP